MRMQFAEQRADDRQIREALNINARLKQQLALAITRAGASWYEAEKIAEMVLPRVKKTTLAPGQSLMITKHVPWADGRVQAKIRFEISREGEISREEWGEINIENVWLDDGDGDEMQLQEGVAQYAGGEVTVDQFLALSEKPVKEYLSGNNETLMQYLGPERFVEMAQKLLIALAIREGGTLTIEGYEAQLAAESEEFEWSVDDATGAITFRHITSEQKGAAE